MKSIKRFLRSFFAPLRPYRNWTRDQMYYHLLLQAQQFNYSEYEINQVKKMVYDEDWNPMVDFNGCNLVQDRLHPYLPCFIHDYRWLVEGGGLITDEEFHSNLLKCDLDRLRAIMYFFAVRLGWLLYYKWKKKFKK